MRQMKANFNFVHSFEGKQKKKFKIPFADFSIPKFAEKTKAKYNFLKSYFLRLEKSRICLWKFISSQLKYKNTKLLFSSRRKYNFLKS